MPSLTQTTGLKLAPLFLQTLVRHYYGKVVKDANSSRVPLRDEELLYDEVFYITKQLLQDATMHTVEEFQSFTKTRSLSPPWENVIRTLIPLSSCDAAAAYLIKVFGGEEAMRCVAGGTKWWQVRSIQGVEAEWVTTKKTFCETSRDRKKGAAEAKRTQDHITSYDSSEDEESITDCLEMDEPCLLYIHGGGYYFGSADGGKSSMERYARMTRGRVFAVDYRLAPQYPFPCAIQDVLAAYLYLIQPPVGAPHCPVNPNKIVICGDSSGGGLALALLQVIRDAGLPLPAGGVLVSPWCDLTHSFHSITTNTDTDVLPATGLSLHKPSLLWPPPPEDITSRVHARLRMFANDVTHDQSCGELKSSSFQATMRKQHGTQMSPQFQFYAENRFLRHPLVSPALAYLGGLPPLFFIAGNGEVLRDEIVYTAHRAAQPEKFPVSEDVKELYPPSGNVKDGTRSTPVHLQVYDDAAHILPVLFPFSTPAKFCVRAIARFVQRVTDMKKATPVISLVTSATTTSSSTTLVPLRGSAKLGRWSDLSLSEPTSPKRYNAQEQSLAKQKRRKTTFLSHAALELGSRTAHIFQFGSEEVSVGGTIPGNSLDDEQLGIKIGNGHIYAGDHMVYNEWAESKDDKAMIRERVSTQGIIRPLEPENELPALALPSDVIGVIQESVLRRYLAAKEQADRKFASIIRGVEKQRARNIDRACKDLALRTSTLRRSSTGYHAAPSSRWRLAWAVDPSERPPPSSIAGRLDMEEALGFAREWDRGLLRIAESTSNQSGMTGLWRDGATRMMAVLLAAKSQHADVAERDRSGPRSGIEAG